MQIQQQAGEHEGQHVNVEPCQTGMYEHHIVQSEEKSGKHVRTVGHLQLAEDKIKQNDGNCAENDGEIRQPRGLSPKMRMPAIIKSFARGGCSGIKSTVSLMIDRAFSI